MRPMTNVTPLPPTDLDLQAYLDDELPTQQRLRVIEWLLENPKKAQELFDIQLREDLLRVAVRLSAPEQTAEAAEIAKGDGQGAGQSDDENERRPIWTREFFYGVIAGAAIAIILTILLI